MNLSPRPLLQTAPAHFPWQEMAYIQHDKCWFHISAVPAGVSAHLRSPVTFAGPSNELEIVFQF